MVKHLPAYVEDTRFAPGLGESLEEEVTLLLYF